MDDIDEMMIAYQAGDADAFRRLLHAMSPRLYRYVGLKAGFGVADDLLQQTWLEVHRARATFDPTRPARAWLFAIARHVVGHHWRSASRLAARERREDASAISNDSPHPTIDREDVLAVRAAIQKLAPNEREVVLLLKYAGLSIDETAAVLATTAGAVKQRSHRALLALRGLLGDDDDEVGP